MEVLPSDTPFLFEENIFSLGRVASVNHPTLTKNAIPEQPHLQWLLRTTWLRLKLITDSPLVNATTIELNE